MIICLFLFHTFADAGEEDQIALFKALELKRAKIEPFDNQRCPDVDLTEIGYTEWLVKTADMEQQFSEAQLDQAFKLLDEDCDGIVDTADLMRTMPQQFMGHLNGYYEISLT